MSHSRPPAPLRGDLPDAVRVLLTELRVLKDESGYDLRALERKTHASRSSWGRWLSGETWIPADAVTSLAALCGADGGRLLALWSVADEARRAPSAPAPEAAPPASAAAVAVPAPPAAPAPPPPAPPAPASPWQGMTRRRRLAFACAAVACLLVPGGIGFLIGTSLHSRDAPAAPLQTAAPAAVQGATPLTRDEILTRARSWHPHSPDRVPYDQAGVFGGYRTDGSGYASMALGLPKPGPNSAGLVASYCRAVPAADLEPGDLVINATGGPDQREALIFEKWTGQDRKAFWAFQQRRGYGTDHLLRRDAPTSTSALRPCRPKNIRETPTG
ncbi:helix-turn-helix domain-containing protein [Actinomadura parmotrematis]|uniref:helix-turn-helix domain-containing protein n=1 Tax=Actinomadura parmotrematis TaxID=2864039 RepID=UPI00215D759C|nr:helix-turn-helix transcriptional regulator [Actinomadura parmotrematis]